MTPAAQEAMEGVLQEGGFVKGGKRASGLMDASSVSASIGTDLRYGHLLTGSIETETVDLVYEIPSQIEDLPGIPSIYFKYFDYIPSTDAIIKLRTLVWNQGRIPTLWVITPDTVLIYDSFARPQSSETVDSHLLTRLARIGQGLQRLKNVAALHKESFDSGAFWQSIYGRKIDRSQRVDESMLLDLSKTVEILTTPHLISQAPALKASVAHALLGRSIFVSYLQDRSILDSSFFEKLYHYSSFKELLKDKKATYSFFKWLRDTFNGNLFPISEEEENAVNSTHLSILHQFLSGTDMTHYPVTQRRFWPYKFDIIPIELISSIYEMFAHNLDRRSAEAKSVHYTRLQLVELLLSLAMRGVEHTARVFDPACGSGVFLVEAFRRLAWLHSKEHGRELNRDELHKILHTQIFGMDIDPDAIDVAAFSLYLALLELDPDPQPPSALKFPSLLPHPSLTENMPNLYVQDFCNMDHFFNQNHPFVNKGFDIIVGNPPWTALNKRTAPRDPDNLVSGRQWSLEYCIRNQIPDKKPDQAFMLRARDFADVDTRIAFIICSRVFYQQENRSWLDTFLTENIIEVVVNFSDLVGENVLFGGQSSTRLPASTILFRVGTPPASNKVTYITPKWYPDINRRDEIVTSSNDIHSLSQRLLRMKPFLWKSAFRGVSRDYRLLDRLQNLPSLGRVLSNAGVSSLAHRGITFGRGEQKTTPSYLLGKPFLSSRRDFRYDVDITPLSLFDRPNIARKSNTKFLQLPALIISRSLHQGRAGIGVAEPINTKQDLVIDQMYYGIPFSTEYPKLIYRLNAVFNSKIAFYMTFMFSSGLGWDRRLIEVGDWLQIRLPETILIGENDELWSSVLQLEYWLRENWKASPEQSFAREISEKEEILDNLIFELYELSAQEIILVKDTIRYGINPLLYRKQKNNSLDVFNSPLLDDLKTYAKRVCLQLNGVLQYNNLRIFSTVFAFDHISSYSVCQFTQSDQARRNTVDVEFVPGLENALSILAPLLRTEIMDNLSLQRNLRIYDKQNFWIIKPSEKRLWNETAALSDADTIVREHMEASKLGQY